MYINKKKKKKKQKNFKKGRSYICLLSLKDGLLYQVEFCRGEFFVESLFLGGDINASGRLI